MNDAVFGFKAGDLKAITDIILRFGSVKKAAIFGSRAKGNYKEGSDVDIALWIDGKDISTEISGVLNDQTLLPYQFDVQDYRAINNKELAEHIDRVGIVFYQK